MTQKMAAIKTRTLKKADFEVDFFFIDGSGVISLSGGPETVAKILGEILKQCQHFFFEIYFDRGFTLIGFLREIVTCVSRSRGTGFFNAPSYCFARSATLQK